MNETPVEPEGTVTLGGTEIEELELVIETTVPLLGAACVRETLQSRVPAPEAELESQESELSAAEVEPPPLLEAFLPAPRRLT